MRRRKKSNTERASANAEMGGQDSFLDIVSNIVGILIILVMIAGVRAQNSAAEIETPPPVPQVDRAQLETLEEEYESLQKKEGQALQARLDIERLKEESAVYDEQMMLQSLQHAELFDMMTSLRAAIDIAAEEKSQETKDIIEAQRQIQENEAKLRQIRSTKEWIASNRPKATVLENVPTPISKTVREEEKEAHFRLLAGRISYVPITEFRSALDINFAQNKDKYFKQELSEGKIGPIEDWNCEFLIARYDVPVRGPYGGGIAAQLELDLVEFLPARDGIGEPLKAALASHTSELLQRLKFYRQDIYTITVWVYPDSYADFLELKKFLHAQGYQVAARPMEHGETISGSPRGTKSSAQ